MDRLELAHETLVRDVGSLAGTVARVELNQVHAEELNKLRFSALDTSVNNISTDLKGFMARVESIISGEAETNQTREGRALVEDYHQWRGTVEDRFDRASTLETQVRLLGRLVVFLGSGSVLGVLVALAALISEAAS